MPLDNARKVDQLVFEFDNFEEFNSNVKGWSTQFKQVGRGLAKVKFRHRMVPRINALDVQFSHSTASFGSSQSGHRTFGFVGGPGCSWCGYDADQNQILRFDSHPEFSTFTPPSFIGRTLSVDEGLLASMAAQLGFEGFMDGLAKSKDILTLDHRAMIRYRSLFDTKMSNETDLLDLVQELIIVIENARDDRAVRRQSASSRHVDTALRYVLENAARAVTVAEICEVLGVGYRTLDRAFKQRMGQGPKSSILAFRLNEVRNELKSSDPTARISDIANAWGFWHLGDFSRIYRREFGELPGETLSK